MTKEKVEKLERADWKVGSADDFLFREEYQLIIGRKFMGWFVGWGVSHNLGNPGSVDFDWRTVYKYEDDPTWEVIGFWHSHPPGIGTAPSQTDYKTMNGWVNSLGRTLLGCISCKEETTGWWFAEPDEDGKCLVLLDKKCHLLFFRKIGKFFIGKLPNV
jgi:hypothetical protein